METRLQTDFHERVESCRVFQCTVSDLVDLNLTRLCYFLFTQAIFQLCVLFMVINILILTHCASKTPEPFDLGYLASEISSQKGLGAIGVQSTSN